ncbi:MAG: hypothetical protein ACOCXH_07140 [Cyclobacteriaceae bacterium]
MKKIKLVLYISFFIFLGIFIFLMGREWDFFSKSINILPSSIPLIFIIAVSLLVVILVVEKFHIQKLKNKVSRLEKDNLNLKAKLFDQEEERKEVNRNIQSFEGSLGKAEEQPKTIKKSSNKNSDRENE